MARAAVSRTRRRSAKAEASADAAALAKTVRASDFIAPLPEPPAPPSAANDDGLPILLGYQGRWVADAADVKVAEKSRRIGLTWAEAFDDVTIAAAKRAAGGTNVFYIGYNFDMAREFIAACAMWAKHLHMAMSGSGEFLFSDVGDDGESRDIKAFRIDFASGFSIVALPSRPRSLRGMQGVVVIDEAAFHDDLAGMLKAAMALLMWGGKVRVVSTHFGSANAFAELVADARAKRKPFSLHTITLDDALKDGLYKRICTARGAAWSAEAETTWREELIARYRPNDGEELFCIPSEGGGAYFPLALLEARQRDDVRVVRWAQTDAFAQLPDAQREAAAKLWSTVDLALALRTLSKDDPTAIGGDFARSGDLSVFWALQTRRDTRRHTVVVVELRNVPYREQEFVLGWLGERVPRFAAMKLDATGNGAYLAERMQQKFGGERVEAVKLSRDWYVEHFPRLKAALEDDAMDIPKDRDILADLRLVTMVDGVPRVPESKRTGGATGQRHGDAAVAAVLAYAASRVDPFSVGYETPGVRPRDRFAEPAERTRLTMLPDHDGDERPIRARGTY